MTYISSQHNQDGVNRNLALSEQENNRVHKEMVDSDLDQKKKLKDDDDKDNQVNDLKEQDELDPEGRGSEQHQGQGGHGSLLEEEPSLESRPAHLSGGDFIDFSA